MASFYSPQACSIPKKKRQAHSITEYRKRSCPFSNCYDIFGLRHKELPNPGVDVILNLVHCFYQPGEGPSGLALFAKHGLAGASKQWKCPVFAAVIFFKPNIPTQWPTGVYWNQGDKSTKFWRYSDNPIKPADSLKTEVEEGAALVRMYKHPGLVTQAQ